MIRSTLALLAFWIPTFVLGQEQNAIPVRSGEHPAYSRLVIQVADQDWILSQTGRDAEFTLQGVSQLLSTESVFDRIPRTRLMNLQAEQLGDDSVLRLSLGCDCLITANVEGSYVVLDIKDAEKLDPSASAEIEYAGPVEDAISDISIAATEAPMLRPDPLMQNSNATEGSDEDAITLEAAPSPDDSAAFANWLADRLEMAAESGLVALPTEVDPQPKRPESVQTLLEPNVETVAPLLPEVQSIDGMEDVSSRLLRNLESLTEAGSGSVRIRVPPSIPISPKTPPEPPQNSDRAEKEASDHCIPDDILGVSAWVDHRDPVDQISEWRNRLIAEFDQPDSESLQGLVQTYIGLGLGLEAKALLTEYPQLLENEEILLELADVVDGKLGALNGILAKASRCSPRNTLWRTIALDETETQAVSDVNDVTGEFAKLSLVTRRVVGPRLVRALIHRDQVDVASEVFAILERASGDHGPEHEIVRGRLLEKDGLFEEAKSVYARLINANSSHAHEALFHLVHGMIDRGERIDTQLLEQVETEAYRQRYLPVGDQLRLVEIKAKADQQSLSSALNVVRMLSIKAPERAHLYFSSANDLFTQAATHDVADLPFLEAVFNNIDIIEDPAITDKTRAAIARTLGAASLPEASLDLLNAMAPETVEMEHELMVEALIDAGDANDALGLISTFELDVPSAESRALARLGRYQDAYAVYGNSKSDETSVALAWRAGDWKNVATQGPADLAALAALMIASPEKADTSNDGQLGEETEGSQFDEFSSAEAEPKATTLASAQASRNSAKDVRDIVMRALAAY